MPNGVQSFLHMDDQWMWRFYLLDRSGKVIAISSRAYFTWTEAEDALLAFSRSLVMAA